MQLSGKLFLSVIIPVLVYGELFAKSKPRWVKDRPIEDGFYIGIAHEYKYDNPSYASRAKQKALTDIISNISISISSVTTHSQFEQNYEVSDEFKSAIATQVKANLSGYELVDTWENKKEYWVYYRLSISKWKSLERARVDAIVNKAKSFYTKGLEEKEKNNLSKSIQYFSQSFDQLKEHLHEDLSTFELKKGRIDLPSEIIYQISDIFNLITFQNDDNIHIGQKGGEFNFKIINSHNGKIVSNFPVNCSNQKDTTKIYKSDTKGLLQIHSSELQLQSGKSFFIIQASANVLLGKPNKENILRTLLDNKSIYGSKNIHFEYAKPAAKFHSSVSSSYENFIIEEIKDEFNDRFFDFAIDTGEISYVLKVNTKHRKGEYIRKYDLHTVYLNAGISIIRTEDNKELYFFSYDNVKGMKKGGIDKALREAFNRLHILIREDIQNKVKF